MIKLFPLDNTSIDIYTDAIKYMRIQVLFIPMVALSIGGLLMFQATNQMAMANFIAVLQACLVFPIASGTMYGVTVNITHNPLHFVITNPLNTGTAGLIITIISIVYLYKYLGHTRFNAKINTNGKTISARFVVPTNYKRLSYAERQLNKSIASSNITSFKKTYHKRFKLTVCCSNKFRKIRFTTKIESR
ncbi:MAG: hypothetical protein K2M43_03285 [Mycoplasmoidaceae bacterium]|nr:hypothetical protein [Mycoplasmoidaceae bacterium]